MEKRRDRAEYLRAYREKNKDVLKQKAKASRDANKDKINDYAANYRKNNPHKIRKWFENNRDRLRDYNAEYRKENLERLRLRRKTDIQYRISINLRARFRAAFKNKSKTGSAIKELGCSIESFMNHIEGLFLKDMNWENYGTVWTFDHKIPLSRFDLTEYEQVKLACNFQNIQPMYTLDNIRKNNKTEAEFIKYKELCDGNV